MRFSTGSRLRLHRAHLPTAGEVANVPVGPKCRRGRLCGGQLPHSAPGNAQDRCRATLPQHPDPPGAGGGGRTPNAWELAEVQSWGSEALVYSAGDQKIYPDIPISTPPESTSPAPESRTCTADANRHAVLLAVDRADLPEGGFSLWISAADPPGCCGDGLTFVAGGQLDASQGATFPPLGADGQLAIGESRIAYGLNTHCGVEWLLRSVNGQYWRATDLDLTETSGIDPIPSAWEQSVGQLDVVVTLLDDTILKVTGLDTDVTVMYTPDPDFRPCL